MLSLVVLNALIEINAYHYTHAHAYARLQNTAVLLLGSRWNICIITELYFL